MAVIAGVKLPIADVLSATSLLLGLVIALAVAFGLRRHHRPTWAGSFALLAAVFLGAYHASSTRPPNHDSLSPIAERKAEPIALRGLITSAAVWKPNPHHRPSDPTSSAWRTQWDIDVESLRDGRQWKPVVASSTLTVDARLDDLFPGDQVEVMGSFRRIAPPSNPGGFDFAKHFQQDAQFVSLTAKSRGQIKLLQSTWRLPLQRVRAKLVFQVDRGLVRWVGTTYSPLAAALVFGQREQVDWEDQQELMATGTLHMLAISGMHVEIVAATILLLSTPFAWRNSTLLIVIISVCGAYAILAGGKPPVLRAVIVVASFALARTLGRPPRLTNILGLAALILVLIRAANIDSVGVQLSFLAVGTIGIFVLDARRESERRSALQGVIEESLNRWNRWALLCFRSLKQTWRLSLWVWLITMPLVWTNFHIIAPIAIPLNVLIAFPLTVSLVSGLICGLLGWLAPVGWLAGAICGWSLALISWLVEVSSQLPLGHLWLPAPHAWWLVSFYGMVVLWLIAFGQTRNRSLLLVLGLWLVIGIAPHTHGPRGWWGEIFAWRAPNLHLQTSSAELRCTFLDVGHGTSVIIEFPTGEVWLYDAGHLGAADRSHQDIATALWQIPTARVAKLLISHADADHYNATRGLIERFRIDSLASPTQFWNSSDRDVQTLLRDLGSSIDREVFNAGQSGQVGLTSYQVLHPRGDIAIESDNAASMCLLLEYAGKRILLPGDLEGSGLLSLTELPPRPCHVLMAPHHGSLTLDPSELLAWCRPQWTVISGNHRATREEVLRKYTTFDSQVAITFRDGAVQIRIDPNGDLTTWHWHADHWQRFSAN